jgi:hypothetical protein
MRFRRPRISRSPIRATSDVPDGQSGDYLVLLTRDHGCIGHPAFRAPSLSRDSDHAATRALARSESAKLCLFGCLKIESVATSAQNQEAALAGGLILFSKR